MTDNVADQPQIETHQLEPEGAFPNNPLLPLLVYRAALRETDPSAVERLLTGNGWEGTWRNGVYGFDHFHSNAHEVLAVCRGSGRVRFGGPHGEAVDVEAGDVAVLPAGTTHCNAGTSADFLIVGGYPPGQAGYDMMRGEPSQRQEAERNIRAAAVPDSDPIYGAAGPLLRHWAG